MEFVCWLLFRPTDSHNLLEAARHGDSDAAKQLCQKQPKTLWKAQKWGKEGGQLGSCVHVSALCVAAGPVPTHVHHCEHTGGQSAWHVAAREGHAETLLAMADGLRAADAAALKPLAEIGTTAEGLIEYMVQTPDAKGLTPLHLACIRGHAAVTDALMKLGANPFAQVGVGVICNVWWLWVVGVSQRFWSMRQHVPLGTTSL